MRRGGSRPQLGCALPAVRNALGLRRRAAAGLSSQKLRFRPKRENRGGIEELGAGRRGAATPEPRAAIGGAFPSRVGRHLPSRCDFGVLGASRMGKGRKSGVFWHSLIAHRRWRASASSPPHTQLSASQAALGLLSESGFVWRLPAGKAAGSPRSDGYSAAARWEKPRELGQHEGEHSGTQVPGKCPWKSTIIRLAFTEKIILG